MALCKVTRDYEGWRAGDHVEAFNSRLKELVDIGIVEVIIPDKQDLKPKEPEKPIAKKKSAWETIREDIKGRKPN